MRSFTANSGQCQNRGFERVSECVEIKVGGDADARLEGVVIC